MKSIINNVDNTTRLEKCVVADKNKHTVFIVLLLIFAFSVSIRIYDYQIWQESPDLVFYNNQALLTNVDGYYYLRIAKDLLAGDYHGVDDLRKAPDFTERKIIPPLLSVFTVFIHKITGISLLSIANFIPAIFGSLLVFPVYLVGKLCITRKGALAAALFSSILFYYYYRTSLGFFDTDCLNVVLSTIPIFFGLKTIEIKENRKSMTFLAICYLGFYLIGIWWWDQAPLIVFIIFLYPLVINFLFFSQWLGSIKWRCVVLVCCSALIVLTSLVLQGEGSFVYTLINYVNYVSKDNISVFPVVSKLVGEQRDTNLFGIVIITTESVPVLVLGVLGILLLIFKLRLRYIYFGVLICFSLLGILYTRRFLIFFTPLIALGLGYIFQLMWVFGGRVNISRMLSVVFCFLVAGILVKTDVAVSRKSQFDPDLVVGFEAIKHNTPTNSIIWTWWDWGYPIAYFGERATIADGSYHGGELSVYSALPFSSNSMRFAANFIRFYSVQGIEGPRKFYGLQKENIGAGLELMKKVFSVRPNQALEVISESAYNPFTNISDSDLLSFLFPQTEKPVYLFIDYDFPATAFWWYWIGTWDVEKGSGVHPRIKPFYQVQRINNEQVGNPQFVANLTSGNVIYNGKEIKMSQSFETLKNGEVIHRHYQHKTDLMFTYNEQAFYAVLQSHNLYQSVFSQLFIGNITNNPYFKLIDEQAPLYKLYKVNSKQ